jgi:hypothetical protein
MQSGQPQLCATGAACVAAICGSGWEGEGFHVMPSSSYFYYSLITLFVLGSISIFKWGCACHAMINRCVQPCMAWHGSVICQCTGQAEALCGCRYRPPWPVLLLSRVDLSTAGVGRVPRRISQCAWPRPRRRARRFFFCLLVCTVYGTALLLRRSIAGVCTSPEKILRIDRTGAATVSGGSTDALIGGTTIHR